jgi:hypothetical protein
MLTDSLTDQQLFYLMAGVLALAVAGLLTVIVWPLGDAPGLSDIPSTGYSADELNRITRPPPAHDPLRRSFARRECLLNRSEG